MLIRKKRGQYLSHLLLSYFQQEKIVLLCHTNNMDTVFSLNTRKELKNIGFDLKFIKKKPILHTFKEHKLINENIQICNGTLLIIYGQNTNEFNPEIFRYLQQNKELSLLTTIWNSVYSNTETFKVYNKLNIKENIYTFNAKFKIEQLAKIRMNYLTKVSNLKNKKIFQILLLHKQKSI